MIATMRNPEKETELAKLDGVVLFQLDVSDRQQSRMPLRRPWLSAESMSSSTTLATGWRDRSRDYPKKILRMINTNLMGPIRATKAFIPHFREKGRDCSSIRAPLAD